MQEHAPENPSPQFTKVARIYDELMSGIAYGVWTRYLETLWSSRALSPRSVLDVACGTGNVSFRLADKGLRVVGVDYSPDMIQIAQQKLSAYQRRTKNANVAFYCQRASEIDVAETFDCAISLFDSLNYVLDYCELLQAFSAVHRHLQPGGVFIFDVNTRYALSHGFFDQDNLSLGRYPRYCWRSTFEPGANLCTIEMDFEVLGEGSVESFHETHYQRAYSRDELHDGLVRSGFTRVEFFHAYTTRKPTRMTDRLFIVAERGA